MYNGLKKTFFIRAVLIVIIPLIFLGAHSISGVVSAGRRGQDSTPAKKAPEQFKNIQVLKDLPADQLYPTMHFMADSLGIQCVDCHVGIPGQVDGARDDKQMKLTAREMIKMTMEINRANFADHKSTPAVTCYTCHRGSRQPLATPPKSDTAARELQP